MKNHSLPWKKKLKKEKMELITTHLKETRAEALRTMTVTWQRLLHEPEAVSDVSKIIYWGAATFYASS